MEFNTTFRIYYDEDVTRETADDVREELANDIMTSHPAITDMTVQTVFMSRPYEAIVDITYNDLHFNTDDSESLSFTQEKNILSNEIVSLPYLHNVVQEQ